MYVYAIGCVEKASELHNIHSIILFISDLSFLPVLPYFVKKLLHKEKSTSYCSVIFCFHTQDKFIIST